MLLIWQGFDHYWQREPHRLNRMASYIAPAGDEPGEGVWTCCMQVGRFPPDACHAHAMLHRLDVPGAAMIPGESTATLAGRVGDRAEAAGVRVSVRVPRPDAAAVVILRGFELQATGFPHGFQTRGFGMWIDGVAVTPHGDHTDVSFVPHFFIHPAYSPDPFTDPSRFVWRVVPFPASLEPSTPTEYEYTLTMHYGVLHAAPGAACFTPFSAEQQARSSSRPYGGWEEVQGAPSGFPLASIGVTGFRFELHDWARTRYSGRYLRKLRMMVDGMTYRPIPGVMAYNPKMEFTNVGGRAGRARARRMFAVLRSRRSRPRTQRIRALARSLRGSYGFEASYRLDAVLLQFEGGTDLGVMRLYNALRRTVTASKMFG